MCCHCCRAVSKCNLLIRKNMQDNNIPSAPTPNGLDQAQFEADKRAVYKHPLFSLLALLLEKCEQATQGYLSLSNSSASSSNETNDSNAENDSFSRDVHAFVQLLEKEKRPLLTNNTELDSLMIKALQVLRIHLLELEKVQELCRDFCTRYIACLRGKMQSENLLRTDYSLETNNNLSNSNSPINSPDQTEQRSISYFNNEFIPNREPRDFNNFPGGFHMSPNNHALDSNYNNELESNVDGVQINSLPTQSQQQSNPIILRASPVTEISGTTPATTSSPTPIPETLGSTSLSQVGCPSMHLDQYSGQLSPCGSSDDGDSELDSNNDEISSNFSNNSGSKRQKRGILPKQATSVMRAWLFQHLVHPYPTEDEKRAIAAQTNLTLLQVNNWFINARRRILQPMLEHASDSNCNQGRKRMSHTSNQSKRLWGENLDSQHHLNSSMIDNNIANINRHRKEFLTSDKLDENFFSSDDSNDSLVIDQEC